MVQAMGSQVMFGQQSPGPGGIEAVCFWPSGQTGHVIIYRKGEMLSLFTECVQIFVGLIMMIVSYVRVLRFHILSGVVQFGCRIMQWKTSFCMQCLSTCRTQTSLNDFPHNWNSWGPLMMANRSALSVIVATTMETNTLFASRTYVLIPGKCDCIPG